MISISKARRAGKRVYRRFSRNSAPPPTRGTPLAVKLPIYTISAGLLGISAWGVTNSGLGAIALGFVLIFGAAEALKPALGELLDAAVEANDTSSKCIVSGAALVCVLLTSAGGVIALHVADAPSVRFEAAQSALARAEGGVAAAQTLVDAVPACTPSMPAARCERMTAENAPLRTERQGRLFTAKADAVRAQKALAATPAPGPGIPGVAMWQKAVIVGGVEFLVFAVPFAARRMRRLGLAIETPQIDRGAQVAVPEAAKADTPLPKAANPNDGGWAARREKYGPSGRRPKRSALRIVAA